jgi:hypothetical protein
MNAPAGQLPQLKLLLGPSRYRPRLHVHDTVTPLTTSALGPVPTLNQ